jgi:hypothetical protein
MVPPGIMIQNDAIASQTHCDQSEVLGNHSNNVDALDLRGDSAHKVNNDDTGINVHAQQTSPSAVSTSMKSDTDAHGSFERPDILWCLTVKEEGKSTRTFYKDEPWKGINNGLPGSDPDEDMESRAVLTYYVEADVKDKTDKEPNTSRTWRDQPVDFEFGRDAVLNDRYLPNMKFYSKRLIKVVDAILDYYPYRGETDFFKAEPGDNFRTLMYCYAELKHYFNSYVRTLPNHKQDDSKLNIGTCGDEKLLDVMLSRLDFGALDPLDTPCDEATAYDLAVLLRLLAGMYRAKAVPTLTSIYLDAKPMIGYANMWLLFRPGTTVYVRQSAFWDRVDADDYFRQRTRAAELSTKGVERDDEYSACVVASLHYEEKDVNSKDPRENSDRLELELWSICYNGTEFQRVRHDATIVKFDNSRPLRDLAIIPAHIYDSSDGGTLRQRLEKRGRKYVSILREPAAHRTYSQPHSGYDGQIIVDPEAYRQYVAEESRYSWLYTAPPAPAQIFDGGGGKRFGGMVEFDPAHAESFSRFQELCLLLPRRTEGFALRTKKWMIFEIEGISIEAPIPLQNQLDSELVLVSDADKESLRTVLPRGEHPISSASDFVVGKGEGKIFLLYGGPGTGKTLTVECVANDTCRPLLRLTAQDVGLQDDVEAHLRKWFSLAAKWDAILLIDEADLFLEQRKEGDLQRNSLSTVFLRSMEYYKGVLFLTTNRPGHIDDSFISRITCPIAYHTLSPETKTKIVQKFVKKFEETGNIVIEPAAARYLISNCKELNGRQLRNVLQNAVASADIKLRGERRFAAKLGREEDLDPGLVTVSLHHVKAAVERQSGFQEYLKKLRGRDEDARARIKHDYLSVPPGSPGLDATM